MVEETVTIGFTASQTGKYNVESTRQINGLNLWMDQVNSAGGITLGDGTVVKFDSVFYAAGGGGNYVWVDRENDLVVVARWVPDLGGLIERVMAAFEPSPAR